MYQPFGLLFLLASLLQIPASVPCTNDDLKLHESDCHKFYKCFNGTWIVQDCPAGLVWNDIKKLCDWVGHVPRCNHHSTVYNVKDGKSQCTNDDLKPHESDCHKFYKCFNGTWIVQDCPAGLVWNDIKKFCDWKEHVPRCNDHSTIYNVKDGKSECTNDDLKLHESDCHKFYKCFNGTWIVQDCPAGLVWNDIKKFCDWVEHVPRCNHHSTVYNVKDGKSECTNDDLKLHESDCQKFYKCFNGTWIVQDCPAGLVWNDIKKFCDWVEHVPRCNHHSTVYNVKDGKSECTNDDLKLHESDCHKFYKCFNGTWIVQDCPAGLVWNDIKKFCDWVEHVPRCNHHSTVYNVKDGKSQCTNDDLKPHESDCHKFYKCFNGTWIVQDCPAGLVWNDIKKFCDWKEHVPRCNDHSTIYNVKDGKSECTNDDLKLHESDCQKFYKCFNGTWIVQDCPAGLVWNDIKKFCDWVEHVPRCNHHSTVYNVKDGKSECTNDDLKLHESDCHKFYKCFNGTWIVQDCPAGLVWNDIKKFCDWVEHVPRCNHHSTVYNVKDGKSQCTNDDLKPHESDCHKFYKCFNGTWIVQDCPAGLVWNDIKKFCDWKEHVPRCNDHSTIYNVKDGKSECTNDDLKLHESDCQKFYKCFNGTWIVQDCPAGLVWNDIKKFCDWVEHVPRCNHHSTVYNVKDGKFECTNDDLKLHESDCHKFYKCFNGTWIVQDCPAGLVWNDIKKFCDWVEHVPRCNHHSTVYNVKDGKSQCTNDDLKPHESDCHKFYKCFNGTWIVQDCPAGLVWNDIKKFCDWKEHVPRCNDHSTIYNVKDGKSECTNDDLKLHESDCHKFYKCFNGTWIVQDCPAGLVWNDIKKFCDWVEHVPRCNHHSTVYNVKDGKSQCTNDDLKPHESDCHKFYKCFNGTWIVQDCPAGLVWNDIKKFCDWKEHVPRCNDHSTIYNVKDGKSECTNDDLKLHESDCHKFYKCFNGTWIVQDCPAGLVWNDIKKFCDWVEHVPRCDHHSTIYNVKDDKSKCTTDDLKENHSDCHKFYKCLNGEWIEHDCPIGLAWNPTNSLCDLPINVPNCT